MIRYTVHLTELFYMFVEAEEEEWYFLQRVYRAVLTHLVGCFAFVDIVGNESSPEELGAAGLDNCRRILLVAVTPQCLQGCLL